MAKLKSYGGNSKVVVAQPDCYNYKLKEDIHDFILIGSDGIFDRISTEEVVQTVWNMNNRVNPQKKLTCPNDLYSEGVDRVLRTAMTK